MLRIKTSSSSGDIREDGTAPATDPVASAKAASLRYVSDAAPGIIRRRSGRGFVYLTGGRIVRDPVQLQRIKSLAIPPAWTDVWICALADGHLQATGRDAKGRKQHRYHPRWRESRDATKYHRMLSFAAVLPRIRRQVQRDLSLAGLPRDKVLATVVGLLEVTSIRVGNEEYERKNGSIGLATMKDRHVDVSGSKIRFQFRGKSGIQHAIDLQDRRMAKIIKRCQDLPGYELFQYVGDDGELHAIDSADVNEYLKQIAGDDFSTKDFRTWSGTVLAFYYLSQSQCSGSSKAQLKQSIVQAIDRVAKKLGNTKAVCRKSYIHPAVIEGYEDGSLLSGFGSWVRRKSSGARGGLRSEEAALAALLRARWKRDMAARRVRRRPNHGKPLALEPILL